MLINEINTFSPDVTIMMLNCTHRDDIVADIEFLKKVSKQYESINKLRLPIVVVINKCDEMAPARIKDPKEYSMNKIDNIEGAVRYYKEIIIRNGLKIDSIVPVSSLIDWQTKDGIEVDAEEIANLPKVDVENLEMAFDGRYNIEELLNILEEAILDFEAQMGLRMAARLTDVVNRFSNHLVKIFSGISATVALTPIPISDIYILIVLQCVLVAMIASLSGRDISLDTAKEFVLSVVGVAGGGHLFKIAAQQLSKLINVWFPGVGSAVSAGVAYGGTYAMGRSAISYYIDGKTLEEAKAVFAKSKEEAVYEE